MKKLEVSRTTYINLIFGVTMVLELAFIGAIIYGGTKLIKLAWGA